MKKDILAFFLLFIIAASAFGCSSEDNKVKDSLHITESVTTIINSVNNKESTSFSDTDDTDISNTVTTIQELKNAIELADISEKGHYNAVLAFLTGDIELLSKYAGVDSSCFSGLDTLVVSNFELQASKREGACLDFSFSVKESDYPGFEPGEYSYYIDDAPIYWHSYDEVDLTEEFEDLEIIMSLLPSAVPAFGESASDLYKETFVIFAPHFIMQMENYFYNTSTDAETLSKRMEQFFGVENSSLNNEYYEMVDGVYRINDKVRYLGLSTAHRIVDVREVDANIIEVDVCFFADKATVCMTNKTTYTFEKGDFSYGYKLLNAKTTEINPCDILRFSN